MNRIRFVLFDFDGVIADTEPSNGAYLQRALHHYGISLTDAEKKSLLGMNEPLRLEQFLRRANTPVMLDTFRTYRKSLGNTYENGTLTPMPGLLSVLEALRQRKIGTALVSSTSTHFIEIGLRRLGLTSYFDVIVCGDMVQHRKPNPEPYQKALQLLNAKPQECLILEDSPPGIQAGKAAGVLVVGFRGSAIQQDTSQADFQLDSFQEFFNIPLFSE